MFKDRLNLGDCSDYRRRRVKGELKTVLKIC